MSENTIQISFIRAAETPDVKPNVLNGLAIDMGSLDSNPNDVTEDEIRKAKSDGRFAGIFKRISAENLFRDLRSFAIARGVIYAKTRELSAEDAIWISENLFLGNYDGSHVGDLAGALHYATGAESSRAIDDKDLLHVSSKLFDDLKPVVERLSTQDIISLLKKHKAFTGEAKKKGVLLLADELAKRKVKSRETAAPLIEILQGDTRAALKTLAGGFSSNYSAIKNMLDISYTWRQIKEGAETTTEFLEKLHKDLPVGAKIAMRVKDVAILGAQDVDSLVSIMESESHDVLTRASIAWALGKAEYENESARRHAADKIANYLKKISPCDWQNTKISRIIFESVIALGQLGVEKTAETNISYELLRYLTDVRHPELRFAAAIAFGFLGSKLPQGSLGQKKIIAYLNDAMSEPDESVRIAAEGALHKIEKPGDVPRSVTN